MISRSELPQFDAITNILPSNRSLERSLTENPRKSRRIVPQMLWNRKHSAPKTCKLKYFRRDLFCPRNRHNSTTNFAPFTGGEEWCFHYACAIEFTFPVGHLDLQVKVFVRSKTVFLACCHSFYLRLTYSWTFQRVCWITEFSEKCSNVGDFYILERKTSLIEFTCSGKLAGIILRLVLCFVLLFGAGRPCCQMSLFDGEGKISAWLKWKQ